MRLFYKDGYKYQSTREYRFCVPDIWQHFLKKCKTDFISYDIDTDEIIVDKWYCWDGPSGPTKDDKTNLRFSFEHDVLFQLMRYGILPRSFKRRADGRINITGKQDKMGKFRRYVWKKFLYFAKFATNPKNIKKEKVVGEC